MSMSWGDIITDLSKKKEQWQYRQIQDAWQDTPFLHKPIIVHSTLDHSCLSAAWITFEHMSVEEYTQAGTWLRGTFRYCVWFLSQHDNAPRLLVQEVVGKKRGANEYTSTQEIACDIDRVAVTREMIYVRDRRILKNDVDLCYPDRWRTFPCKP